MLRSRVVLGLCEGLRKTLKGNLWTILWRESLRGAVRVSGVRATAPREVLRTAYDEYPGFFRFAIFFALILICAKPLGVFMANLFEGRRTFLHPLVAMAGSRDLQSCRALGKKPSRAGPNTPPHCSASASSDSCSCTCSSGSRVFCPSIRRASAPATSPRTLAFNTAISFITNTNWQAYAGESTLSYFVQMAALTVQNFASAAAGIAVAIALVRGFCAPEKKTIGNFWVDVTRATVYVLLPISVIAACCFCARRA